MSIEQQPDSEKATQIYLLNGVEVPMTKEQAELTGAKAIGHSGDLGLEQPPEGAKTVTHNIPAPESPAALPEVKKPDHDRGNKLMTRGKMKLVGGVAAIATGLVGSTVSGLFNGDEAPEKAETSASASEAPGEIGRIKPSLETPIYEFTDMTYEDAVQPAKLNTEQLATWNTSDHEARNDLVSELLALRTSYAINDLYRTQNMSETPDLSYVTHDPEVVEKLKNVLDDFTYGPELTSMFYVCETTHDGEWGNTNVCNPLYQEGNPTNLAPKPEEKTVIYVNHQDDSDPSRVNFDKIRSFEFSMEPTVDEDGVMTWVSK